MTSMMIVTKKDADEMNGDRFHYKTTSAKSETPTSISIWSNPQMHSNQFNIQPNLAKADQHFHNDKKLRWKLEIVTTTTFFLWMYLRPWWRCYEYHDDNIRQWLWRRLIDRNNHFLMITFHSETKLIEAEKNTWQRVVLLLLVVIGGEHLNDNIMVE